jgi:hypothetical protein
VRINLKLLVTPEGPSSCHDKDHPMPRDRVDVARNVPEGQGNGAARDAIKGCPNATIYEQSREV